MPNTSPRNDEKMARKYRREKKTAGRTKNSDGRTKRQKDTVDEEEDTESHLQGHVDRYIERRGDDGPKKSQWERDRTHTRESDMEKQR